MKLHPRPLARCCFAAIFVACAARLTVGCGSDAASNGPSDDADGATPPDESGEADAGHVTPTPHGFCLAPGNGDYTQPGPYAVATKSVDLASTGALPADGGATTYELFYPENMDDGCPHPFIAWGNGLGIPGSYAHAFMNRNLASWGLVVIASDNPVVVHGVSAPYHTAAIDYMLAQNQDPSSLFYGKLSTRVGTAGCSLGGAAATLASAHPNVEATMLLESAGFPKAGIAFLVLCGTNDTVVGTGPRTRGRSSTSASTPRGSAASWATTRPRARCSRAEKTAASAAIRTGRSSRRRTCEGPSGLRKPQRIPYRLRVRAIFQFDALRLEQLGYSADVLIRRCTRSLIHLSQSRLASSCVR